MFLCSVWAGMGDTEQQLQWEAKERIPSWPKQGPRLQGASTLRPRDTLGLTWSISSNGKRSIRVEVGEGEEGVKNNTWASD